MSSNRSKSTFCGRLNLYCYERPCCYYTLWCGCCRSAPRERGRMKRMRTGGGRGGRRRGGAEDGCCHFCARLCCAGAGDCCRACGNTFNMHNLANCCTHTRIVVVEFQEILCGVVTAILLCAIVLVFTTPQGMRMLGIGIGNAAKYTAIGVGDVASRRSQQHLARRQEPLLERH